MTSKNSKDHEASEQFVTTSTIGKSFIESGDRTAALPDEIKREYFETFDGQLAKFDRKFTDNLPVLSTFAALDPSPTKFLDTELLKRFFTLYGELNIDDILLRSQAYIAKYFLFDGEQNPENFLSIVDNLQALQGLTNK